MVIILLCYVSVVTMRNPIHALSTTLLLEEDKFDLIMADLYLPNVAGLQVIRRLREESKLPLICESIIISFYCLCVCVYKFIPKVLIVTLLYIPLSLYIILSSLKCN